MKKILKSTLFTALILIALGIYMVLSPGAALANIIKIIGIALIVAGAVTVLLYVFNKDSQSRSFTSLATGIILVIAGIVFLVKPGAIEKIFPTVVGILVIVNGILINGGLCTGEAVIPDGVTDIAGNAFYYCTDITSLTIPDSVTKLGIYVFLGCSGF